ncbi:hypothetical protein M3Y95_01074700 [Aphelenchoides besseyi]|nr:hypothetical protein M3Y95_01074700 [Aphelenchoides besseyi]
MQVMKLLLSVLLLVVAVESNYMPPWIYASKAPSMYFTGRITENGKPVPAHISVEFTYKNGDELIPLSVVQVDSLPDYRIGVNMLLLQDPKFQSTAYIRVQSLSANGGSRAVKFQMEEALEYTNDVELNDKE